MLWSDVVLTGAILRCLDIYLYVTATMTVQLQDQNTYIIELRGGVR